MDVKSKIKNIKYNRIIMCTIFWNTIMLSPVPPWFPEVRDLPGFSVNRAQPRDAAPRLSQGKYFITVIKIDYFCRGWEYKSVH